jgi:hypothetical protein
MIRWRFPLTSSVVLASVLITPAYGQTPKIQKDVNEKLAQARHAQTMGEHIEVFRRLLGRGVAETYPMPVAADRCPAIQGVHTYSAGVHTRFRFGPETDAGKSAASAPIEGVYLKGHGIVYTITLPPPPGDPLANSAAPAKPTSPWDRELQALRGDKTEAKPTTPAAPPSLSETVVRLLADNGKHFTELADTENVTVAVVFRTGMAFPVQDCMNCHAAEGSKSRLGTSDPNAPALRFESGAASGRRLDADTALQDAVRQTREALALGDLHARQGKFAEAVQEYMKAEPVLEKLLAPLQKNPEQFSEAYRLQAVLLARELWGKLSLAMLAQGQGDAARQVLQVDYTWAKWLDSSVQRKTLAQPAPATVPARLTITASKKSLEAVGSGKMALDDFRKAVTIDYLALPKSEPSDK